MVTVQARLEKLMAEFPSPRGYAVFSSASPLFHLWGREAQIEIERILRFFSELSATTNILMPTFPVELSLDRVNLDTERSSNGFISEEFRKRFPQNRTVSRYFPFSVAGPDAEFLFSLRPKHAWGDGSLYEWIENNDLKIVTIGLPTYVCSVQHRVEYVYRDAIDYRREARKSNQLLVRGEEVVAEETLLARKNGVEVDFRPISASLPAAGQRLDKTSGITVSVISARLKLELAGKMLSRNPRVFVKK